MNIQYSDDTSKEVVLIGRGVSPGLAFGPINVNARGFSAPDTYNIKIEQIDDELENFRAAIAVTKEQLIEIKEQVEELSGDKESQIFEAHVFLLEDKSLLRKVEEMLRERRVCVAYCYYAVIQSYMEAFRRAKDPYLAERTADLEDVAMRLLDNLLKQGSSTQDLVGDHVLVSFDLTPSDTVSIDKSKMLGFATEQGSYTSHTAILARSLGLSLIHI